MRRGVMASGQKSGSHMLVTPHVSFTVSLWLVISTTTVMNHRINADVSAAALLCESRCTVPAGTVTSVWCWRDSRFKILTTMINSVQRLWPPHGCKKVQPKDQSHIRSLYCVVNQNIWLNNQNNVAAHISVWCHIDVELTSDVHWAASLPLPLLKPHLLLLVSHRPLLVS